MSYVIETKDNNKVWETGYTIYCQSGIGSPFNAFEYDKIQGENEQFFPTAEGAMTFTLFNMFVSFVNSDESHIDLQSEIK